MLEPLAAIRLAEAGIFLSWAQAGSTERSAPVSTKKERPDSSSITDKDPTLESIEDMCEEGVPGVNPSRRARFPTVGS